MVWPQCSLLGMRRRCWGTIGPWPLGKNGMENETLSRNIIEATASTNDVILDPVWHLVVQADFFLRNW